jgi:hypothetical protein
MRNELVLRLQPGARAGPAHGTRAAAGGGGAACRRGARGRRCMPTHLLSPPFQTHLLPINDSRRGHVGQDGGQGARPGHGGGDERAGPFVRREVGGRRAARGARPALLQGAPPKRQGRPSRGRRARRRRLPTCAPQHPAPPHHLPPHPTTSRPTPAPSGTRRPSSRTPTSASSWTASAATSSTSCAETSCARHGGRPAPHAPHPSLPPPLGHAAHPPQPSSWTSRPPPCTTRSPSPAPAHRRAIFTPLLAAIDAGEIDPEPYAYGSRGPPSQDPFLASTGGARGGGRGDGAQGDDRGCWRSAGLRYRWRRCCFFTTPRPPLVTPRLRPGYVRSSRYTWRPRTLEVSRMPRPGPGSRGGGCAPHSRPPRPSHHGLSSSPCSPPAPSTPRAGRSGPCQERVRRSSRGAGGDQGRHQGCRQVSGAALPPPRARRPGASDPWHPGLTSRARAPAYRWCAGGPALVALQPRGLSRQGAIHCTHGNPSTSRPGFDLFAPLVGPLAPTAPSQPSVGVTSWCGAHAPVTVDASVGGRHSRACWPRRAEERVGDWGPGRGSIASSKQRENA